MLRKILSNLVANKLRLISWLEGKLTERKKNSCTLVLSSHPSSSNDAEPGFNLRFRQHSYHRLSQQGGERLVVQTSCSVFAATKPQPALLVLLLVWRTQPIITSFNFIQRPWRRVGRRRRRRWGERGGGGEGE